MTSALTRRRFLVSTAASGVAATAALALPAYSRAAARPIITHGLQSGDVDTQSAMIWARADRPSRMLVEVDTTDSFANPRRLAAIDALPESDFAVKRLLESLPSDQEIFYRVAFQDLNEPQKAFTFRIPDIHNPPRGIVRYRVTNYLLTPKYRRETDQSQNRLDKIVYVSEVTIHLSVIKYIYRL